MLGSIRKFSKTIYAKILLGIIIIPFVFWGMGSSLSGGNKNVIVVIEKEKYSIQEFTDFIRANATPNQKIKAEDIESLLSAFIGEKLIEKEIEHYEIKLSDNSLSKLIKHQKDFMRENKFSRTEYEKFLLKNNITAINFESQMSKQEKKKQLLNFISGGIMPSKFLVNQSYDKINQKRNIEFINLNDLFKKKLNFSEEQINSYFDNNKNKYTEIFKSVRLIELNPANLVGNNEFNEIFFKKLDEMDNLIIEGKNLNFIIKKFNLIKADPFTFNKSGLDINSENIVGLPKNLLGRIFNLNDSETITLIEINDKYFVVEIVKTESIQKKIENISVRKKILLELKTIEKRKFLAELISKININSFNKSDFDRLSKDENISISKITLEDQEDDKILKKEIVNQIYRFSENKVIVVHDIDLSENYLVYIDKIMSVTISENSKAYRDYKNLSKLGMVNDLYKTYDNYIKKRYKIDINYQALDTVKNYYN